MGKEGVLHVAPPADRVPFLVKQLLGWLAGTDAHPLVAAPVFHYEFEVIHPFADGNGRLGRLWQTLILSRWKPVFADLPVESLIHRHQSGYYQAINQSTQAGDAAPFVEFMLQRILDALATDQETDQVTDQVKRLLRVMGKSPRTARQLMAKLKLTHLPTFRQNYLRPALDSGHIDMTRPDALQARNQQYRLTPKGMKRGVGYGG
jgi:Fic family protein